MNVDITSKKMIDTANKIKRTSYLAELEYKFCIALNCKGYPTFDGSPIFNAMLDYIELFYDKADVIGDIQIYLRLFQVEDAQLLKEKIKQKVDNLENSYNSSS